MEAGLDVREHGHRAFNGFGSAAASRPGIEATSRLHRGYIEVWRRGVEARAQLRKAWAEWRNALGGCGDWRNAPGAATGATRPRKGVGGGLGAKRLGSGMRVQVY